MYKEEDNEGTLCAQLLNKRRDLWCVAGITLGLVVFALLVTWFGIGFMELISFVGGFFLLVLASIRSQAMVRNFRLSNMIQSNDKYLNNVRLLAEVESECDSGWVINEPLFFGALNGLDSLAKTDQAFKGPVQDVLVALNIRIFPETTSLARHSRRYVDEMQRARCHSELINRLFSKNGTYDTKNMQFNKLRLENLAIGEVDFVGTGFSNTAFVNVKFSSSSLAKAKFGSGCVFSRCALELDVRQSEFLNLTVEQTKFIGSRMSDTLLAGMAANQVVFPEKMSATEMSNSVVIDSSMPTRLFNCTLTEIMFVNVDFNDTVMEKCKVQACVFENCAVPPELKEFLVQGGNEFK